MITILNFGFIIWYLNIHVHAGERALIFNLKTHSLVDIPTKNSSNVACTGAWATACPARNNEGEDSTAKDIFPEGALFLRNIYNEKNSYTEIEKDRCNEPYKISIIHSNGKIEFGYQILFRNLETSEFSANFHEEHFSWPDPSLSHQEENGVIRYENSNFFENESYETFLHEVWLKSDQVQKITYQIYENNTNPLLPCQNYNLGKEILTNTNVDFFYSEKNQKEFFQDMTLPPIGSEGACTSEYKCLTKWLLIPSDQFKFGSSSTRVQCSNIPTIPIWSSTTENILRRLDVYLYTLSRVLNKPLRIVAGVNQYLQLPNKQLGINNYVILVKEKNILVVPKIIYKIVQLKSTTCKNFECWHSVLIVIHNGPYISDQDQICEDKSENLGWEDIRYETWSNEASKSKFIYVCPITEEILEKIGLTTKKISRFEEFSLLNFPLPHFNEADRPFEGDIKEKVFDELKQLSKSDEWSRNNENYKLIERPQIDDDDFEFVEGKSDKKFIIITHRLDQPLSGV